MTDRDDDLTTFTPPKASEPDTVVTTATPPQGQASFDAAPTMASFDAAATMLPTSSPATSFATSSFTGATGIPQGQAPSGAETGPLTIGERFGRYTIVRLLGIGGMGAVYQAWDEELEVVVALKVIRPEAMRDPIAEQEIERRFKRELLLARQVTHKNVVRIHDLGELKGIKYITMSYVAGTDLSTLVKQEGRLPVPKVLRIISSIVSGLVAAHAAGVVHRDLKPANIMIDKDGEALIMDFGIARSTGGPSEASASAAAPAGLTLGTWHSKSRHADSTMAGTIVGTVEYMAPEQARGEPADQRADVYATGLILYDLLVGKRRAERAESAVAELRGRMERPLPPLKTLAPEVPDALAAIVTRAVEPDLTKRYQATTQFADDLARLDANGEPLPLVRRLTPRMMAATAVLVIALLGGTYFVTRRAVEPTKQHEPVSVLIADFRNGTNDSAFDRTLEPMLKRALEGAGFISAYDRDAIRRTLGVPPPERLDEDAARSLAVKQGLGVVLAGSLEPQGSGYRISVKATETVTGKVIASAQGRASSKEQVLDAATRLITRVRSALGDEASQSAQMFAMASVSATSLDVVGHWVAGREAASRNDYEEALRSYSKAVELDPKFGLGYAGLANVSANRAKKEDAQKYITEALRYVDGMTERERYTTRAGSFRLTGDYRGCVKEYGDLLISYPADVAARNNLAICWANLRDFGKAFDEVRKVVAILPNRAMYRVNLASYANFSSDFQTGEQEAGKVGAPDVNALMAVAFARLGQGQLAQAMETYQTILPISTYGASLATSGLGDLANIEGRFSDASRIFEQGAAQDLTFKRPNWAAAKLAALAHTELLRGRPRAAIAAAEKALMNDSGLNVRFMVARAFVGAGEVNKARPLIAALAAELLAEPRAYAKIVEGEIALKNGDPRQAIEALTQANTLLDTWLGHFDLGRAYFEAGQFTQADSEFDRCLKRRGEALQLILGDEPTYAYLPPVYYYQGRVREGLKTARFAESYREYLKIRGKSSEDPLLPDVRRRAGR